MTYEEERITPTLAKKYLEVNTSNRRVREKMVRMLASEMASGNWYANGQTISFYEDGSLCDGQHRLHAVILAGTPQSFIVVRGVERKAAKCIDTHNVRTVSDRLRIGEGDNWFTANKAAIIRFSLWIAGHSDKATADLIYNVTDLESRSKIDFVSSNIQRRRGIGAAPFQTAVASAYGYEDTDRLIAFCDSLKTGICRDKGDTGAVRAKELAMVAKPVSYTDKYDLYIKIQRAVEAYCNRIEIYRLHPPKKEIYPPPIDLDRLKQIKAALKGK